VAIVASRFNDFIVDKLVGARWTRSPATGPAAKT
jgi:6,7-dimethyl-8-ribityllumazine synthase